MVKVCQYTRHRREVVLEIRSDDEMPFCNSLQNIGSASRHESDFAQHRLTCEKWARVVRENFYGPFMMFVRALVCSAPQRNERSRIEDRFHLCRRSYAAMSSGSVFFRGDLRCAKPKHQSPAHSVLAWRALSAARRTKSLTLTFCRAASAVRDLSSFLLNRTVLPLAKMSDIIRNVIRRLFPSRTSKNLPRFSHPPRFLRDAFRRASTACSPPRDCR